MVRGAVFFCHCGETSGLDWVNGHEVHGGLGCGTTMFGATCVGTAGVCASPCEMEALAFVNVA